MPFPVAGHRHRVDGVHLVTGRHQRPHEQAPVGLGRHHRLGRWLRHALIEAARAAAHTKSSYYAAQYARIARRREPNKAAVAVANSMLSTIWHLLTNGALFEDPGADYFEHRNGPDAEAKRRRIEALGFDVNLTRKAA
jgi:hypothetical protein